MQNNRIQITDGTKTMVITREQLDNAVKNNKVEVDRLKVKCIDKQRDKNGNITAYLVQDINGETRIVSPQMLKQTMFNYQVDCLNLTLTSDGRLVDASDERLTTTSENNVKHNTRKITFKKALDSIKANNKLLDEEALYMLLEIAMDNKYKILSFEAAADYTNWDIHEIKDYNEIKHNNLPIVYLIHTSNTEHIILIPNNVEKLTTSMVGCGYDAETFYLHDNIEKLKGNLIVVGGKDLKSLKSCNRLFSYLTARTINLNYFNMKLTDIGELFFGCTSKVLTTDKLILDAYNNEVERIRKIKEAIKILYLMGAYIDDNNNKIYVIDDGNGKRNRYNISQLNELLDSTYTLLNFVLTEDGSNVKYKNCDYNTNYALIGLSHINYEIIDKRNGNKVGDDIIGKEPIDGVRINDGKVVTFMPVTLSEYASNTSNDKDNILDYDIIKFIDNAIFEFTDHGHEAEYAMEAAASSEKCPGFGGSAGDDARSFYNQAIGLKKAGKLTAEDIRAITYNLDERYKNNKYFDIAREMESYYFAKKEAPDEFYDKVLKLTALPKWTKSSIKRDLYSMTRWRSYK